MVADQDQRRERKRVQNREAQRSRMKKRVEDLEREVTTLRQQVPAHHHDLATFVEGSGDQGPPVGGDKTTSNASVVTDSNEAVPIPEDDERTSSRNRKRTRRAPADAGQGSYDELPEMGVKGTSAPRNQENPAERVPSGSTLSSSSRPLSHSRFGSEVVASVPQAKSPEPQHDAVSQDRATSVPHAESDGFVALLSDDLSHEPGPPLLSPSSSSMSTGAYYNPAFLGHWPAGSPFSPWSFSPPISAMGTYPGVPFPGYQYPLHQAGQYHSGQEGPWPPPLSEHESRRDVYGQQGSLPDKVGTSATPEPHPRQPAATSTRNATGGLISPDLHPRDSPMNVDAPVSVPIRGLLGVSDMRRPSELFLDGDGEGDVGLDSDLEMASTSGDQTPELSQTSRAKTPSPDKIVDALLCELRLQNKERMCELSDILQEVLDGIRAGDQQPDHSNGTQRNGTSRKENGSAAKKPPPTHNYDQSLEDRFEFLQLCVAAAGFSSMDDMVGQYYTADFRQDSPVTRQQRISRHKQLPLLFVKLRSSTQTWTQWEAYGYQSEIMKSAVSLIQNEREAFSPPRDLFSTAAVELQKVLSGELPNGGAGGGGASRRPASSAGALQHLVKTLQDKMPKLWLFTEELENVDGSQRQQLYTSLATVLLLCCARGVPSSETRALAIDCLSFADK